MKSIVLFLVFSFALSACAPKKPKMERTNQGEDSAIAAVINGEPISAGQIERRYEKLPEFLAVGVSTPEQKANNLSRVAMFELIADDAEKKGYGNDPRTIKRFRKDIATELVDAEFMRGDPVTDQDIESYYQQHLDKFTPAKSFRLTKARFANPEDAEALLAELKSVTRLQRLKRFGQMIHDKKLVESKNLGFTSNAPGTSSKTVAFDLIPPDKNGVFYLVTGALGGSTESLESVKDQIRAELIKERRLAARQRLVGG